MIAEATTYMSVLFAFLAAWFWFRSCRVEVTPSAGEDPSGQGTSIGKNIITSIDGRRVNLSATLVQQSKLNGLGAIFAGLSAACQALSLLAARLHWV